MSGIERRGRHWSEARAPRVSVGGLPAFPAQLNAPRGCHAITAGPTRDVQARSWTESRPQPWNQPSNQPLNQPLNQPSNQPSNQPWTSKRGIQPRGVGEPRASSPAQFLVRRTSSPSQRVS